MYQPLVSGTSQPRATHSPHQLPLSQHSLQPHGLRPHTIAPVSPSTHSGPQSYPKALTEHSKPVNKSSVCTVRSPPHNLSSNENDGRKIYLYNLPCSVNQQAIKEHFASVGTIDRCLVKADRQRPSKYKLTAVATFRTSQQAQTAIERFDGSMWKDCEIKVKLDRGAVVSNTSAVRKGKAAAEIREGPLVINGSGPSLSSRHSRIDSDDDDDSGHGE